MCKPPLGLHHLHPTGPHPSVKIETAIGLRLAHGPLAAQLLQHIVPQRTWPLHGHWTPMVTVQLHGEDFATDLDVTEAMANSESNLGNESP